MTVIKREDKVFGFCLQEDAATRIDVLLLFVEFVGNSRVQFIHLSVHPSTVAGAYQLLSGQGGVPPGQVFVLH